MAFTNDQPFSFLFLFINLVVIEILSAFLLIISLSFFDKQVILFIGSLTKRISGKTYSLLFYLFCFLNLMLVIFATGSEVEIAVEAKDKLQQKGIGVRVVSMPCWRLFDKKSNEYKLEILSNNSIKAAVEAGSSLGWHKYIGQDGIFIGMENFGCSAPYKKLYEHFNINADSLVEKILDKLKK